METLTHRDVFLLKNEFVEMKDKFDEVYYALVGNKLTNDGGLVKRIGENETEIEEIRSRIEDMEKKNVKSELYVKILWGTGGFIASALFTYILQLIFRA